jgi:hypothetical protein
MVHALSLTISTIARCTFNERPSSRTSPGQLEIRGDGLTFTGEVFVEIALHNVMHVAEMVHTYRGDEYKAVALQERKRRTPTRFAFVDKHDAAYAFKLITLLRQHSPHELTPSAESRSTATDPAGTTVDLPGSAGFGVGVSGESYRQASLRALAGERLRHGEDVFFIAVLAPEPANPHDRNAVRVHIQGGAQVGYLSRDDAAAYQPMTRILVAKHLAGLCRAKLIGGTPEKPSIGVVLSLASPEEVLAALAPHDQPF